MSKELKVPLLLGAKNLNVLKKTWKDMIKNLCN